MKKNILVIMACHNSVGEPELIATHINCTPSEINLGLHYERAEALALEHDYEKPIVCFDEMEAYPFLLQAVKANKIGMI